MSKVGVGDRREGQVVEGHGERARWEITKMDEPDGSGPGERAKRGRIVMASKKLCYW